MTTQKRATIGSSTSAGLCKRAQSWGASLICDLQSKHVVRTFTVFGDFCRTLALVFTPFFFWVIHVDYADRLETVFLSETVKCITREIECLALECLCGFTQLQKFGTAARLLLLPLLLLLSIYCWIANKGSTRLEPAEIANP